MLDLDIKSANKIYFNIALTQKRINLVQLANFGTNLTLNLVPKSLNLTILSDLRINKIVLSKKSNILLIMNLIEFQE